MKNRTQLTAPTLLPLVRIGIVFLTLGLSPGIVGARNSPSNTAPLSEVSFAPQDGVFKDAIPDVWGKGIVLGALWRYDLPFSSQLRGLELTDTKGFFIERQKNVHRAILWELKLDGKRGASISLPENALSLKAGVLGDQETLVTLADPDALTINVEQRTTSRIQSVLHFAFAEFSGKNYALLTSDSQEPTTITAHAGDGHPLWKESFGNLEYRSPILTGKVTGDPSDALVLFSRRGMTKDIRVVDARGRAIKSIPYEGWFRLHQLVNLNDDRAQLATVQSSGVGGHDLLQIWGVEQKKLALKAEADLGWAVPDTIAAADLDGDGTQEIILGTKSGWVLVYSPEAQLMSEFKFSDKISFLAPGKARNSANRLLVGVEGIPSKIYLVSTLRNPDPLYVPKPKPKGVLGSHD